MLAIIGVDGNLSVYDAHGKNPITITTDAAPSIRAYQWPTWATDGRLAFFGASNDPAGEKYTLRAFIQKRVKHGETFQATYTSRDEIFTYAHWAPGDCDSGDCRDLALLFTPADQQGLALRLIRDNQGHFTHHLIGRAAPFYFSFSADGKQLFWHQFSRSLAIYDIHTEQKTDLADTPGQFNTPMWSPMDNRLLYAIAGATPQQTNIVITQADQLASARQVLIRNVNGPVSFAWSPDARMVATLAGTELSVIDASSGNVLANVGGVTIVAHFWSPQSDRLAYIVFNRPPPQNARRFSANGFSRHGHNGATQQENSLEWYILDVKTGQAVAVSDFVPSRDMIYYLNFFDQFARSHSLWSPDGNYLVYGAVDSIGQQSVMLVDTRTPRDPIRVAGGSIGIWSWQ